MQVVGFEDGDGGFDGIFAWAGEGGIHAILDGDAAGGGEGVGGGAGVLVDLERDGEEAGEQVNVVDAFEGAALDGGGLAVAKIPGEGGGKGGGVFGFEGVALEIEIGRSEGFGFGGDGEIGGVVVPPPPIFSRGPAVAAAIGAKIVGGSGV